MRGSTAVRGRAGRRGPTGAGEARRGGEEDDAIGKKMGRRIPACW